MSRTVTETQVANIEARSTKPIYVVAWEHSGVEELLSASGDIILDGKNYTGGGIDVVRIIEGISASFSVYPTTVRVTEIQNNTWRGGACTLYYIPAAISDSNVFALTDAIVVLQGFIDASQYSGGSITVTAIHTHFDGNYTPRHLVSSVSNHIPAAGTAIVWEGGRFILEARDRFVLSEPIDSVSGAVLGRPTAADIQSFVQPSDDKHKLTTAEGAFVRLNYGRDLVAGEVFAQATDGTNLFIGVVWTLGEIESIDRCYIDGELMPTGVRVRHYRGTITQVADQWLADNITAYSDTMVLSEPSGDIGVAYTVFFIPPSVLATVPTSFKADGQWKKVEDPRSPVSGDPHATLAGFSIEFTGTNGDTSGTDDGPSGFTLTFGGNAEIQSNQLDLDATGDTVDVESSDINLTDDDFTIEIKATPNNITNIADLICKGSIAVKGFLIRQDNGDLEWYMSSNGTSYDLVNGTVVHTLPDTSEFYLTIERSSDWIVFYIDGDEVYRRYTTETIFETTENWTIGGREHEASSSYDGQIRVARLCIGKARYQVPYPTTATPFADDGIYTTTKAYSDTTALCLADLATSEIYGLGTTTTGLTAAADWNEELALDGLARCRLSLSLSAPRKTTDLIDLFAMYADCIVFNEGSSLVIRPDQAIGADNPSGQNVALDSAFDSDTGWTTQETGWSVAGGLGVCDGTQVALTAIGQTVVTEVGTQYAVSFDLDVRNAGSVSIEFGGVEVITAQTVVASYSVVVTATGATAVLEAIGTTDFDGSINNFRCDRLFYLTTQIRGAPSLTGLSDKDAVSRVTARIKTPSDTLGSWGEQAIQYSLPGVDLNEAALKPTSLTLPGVYREEEGNNKANQMLLRSVNQTICQWVSKDDGIIHQKGNVVHLKLDNHGVSETFWIKSITTIEAGRYSVSGVRYDVSHYPSELLEPVGAGVVPVGAIVMLAGAAVPAGWAAYTAADGKFIMGAGDTYAPTDTGGSATSPAMSGSNTASDGHDSILGTMNVRQPVPGGGAGSVRLEYTAQGYSTTHTHTYNTGLLTPDLLRRENILIEKTGSTSAKFPVSVMPFGLPGIVIPNCARVVSAAGRLLAAATTNANLGVASQFVPVVSGSTAFTHSHFTSNNLTNRTDALAVQRPIMTPLSSGVSHSHTYNFSLVRSVKQNSVALYGGTADFSVAPGVMVMWAGTIGSIPADWYLCDGANGTQDLTDHFIQIAAEGAEDVSSGDNTLSINSNGTSHSHDHDNDTSVDTGINSININHSNQVTHRHNITDSDSWTPEYFALAMIMFNP